MAPSPEYKELAKKIIDKIYLIAAEDYNGYFGEKIKLRMAEAIAEIITRQYPLTQEICLTDDMVSIHLWIISSSDLSIIQTDIQQTVNAALNQLREILGSNFIVYLDVNNTMAKSVCHDTSDNRKFRLYPTESTKSPV